MSNLNRVMLIGNLGADPEVKYLPSGQAVCTLSMATNEKWTDKDGKPQEKVEWHRVVVWGKVAENCGKYLSKGRPVFVEGKLTTRSWDDKETGEKKYITEVNAFNVQFLGSGDGKGRRETPPDDAYGDSSSNGTSKSDAGPPVGNSDIPF